MEELKSKQLNKTSTVNQIKEDLQRLGSKRTTSSSNDDDNEKMTGKINLETTDPSNNLQESERDNEESTPARGRKRFCSYF